MDDSERVIQELSECPTVHGLTLADILELPDSVRGALQEMMRGHLLTHEELCAWLQLDDRAAQQVIDLLVEKGYVRSAAGIEDGRDEPSYEVVLSPIRGRPIADDLL